MKQEYEELAKEMLSIKTKEETRKFYTEKGELIDGFVKEGGELAKKALIHLSIILTPEDYDDDICD